MAISVWMFLFIPFYMVFFTAHVRSTREGNNLTRVCLFTEGVPRLWTTGYPHPWMGVPYAANWGGGGGPIQLMGGYPHPANRVVPPSRSVWGTHRETELQREHLLRGGRYSSCVHAGGLSCLSFFSQILVLNLLDIEKFFFEHCKSDFSRKPPWNWKKDR